jgi:hypothetical protein
MNDTELQRFSTFKACWNVGRRRSRANGAIEARIGQIDAALIRGSRDLTEVGKSRALRAWARCRRATP